MIFWTLAVLSVIVAGSAVWRFVPVQEWGFRIAIAFAAGTVWLTTVMFVAAVVGIEWRVWWLVVALLLPALLARALPSPSVIPSVARNPGGGAGREMDIVRTAQPPSFLATLGMTGTGGTTRRGGMAAAAISVCTAITAYGTLTARETCADLLYFWGPKAVRFAQARTIDLPFLADPAHALMHPDYPPLVPLLYGWGAMFAWSWWGPLLLTAVLVPLTAFVLQPFSKTAAMLMAALLAFLYAQGLAAGAAEPLLVFFEVVALTALIFLADTRGGTILASIALAGTAMTKVEGAAFVAIAVAAYVIVRRKPVRALAISTTPAILLGAWLAYAHAHGLTTAYNQGAFHFSTMAIAGVIKEASYHAYYLPWLAVMVPLVVAVAGRWSLVAGGLRGRGVAKFHQRPATNDQRPVIQALLTAAGTLAATIWFYMHGDDPTLWIALSAGRVLITPLACLAVALAGASE